MRRFAVLATAAASLLFAAAPALGATPFNAGTGSGWDLAVGGDGIGHVVWVTDETGDRVGYCRVPAGGLACDTESGFLSFPAGAAANGGQDAQVFTPAASKVVILASCYVCGAGGAADRTYRWISSDNGANFGAPTEVGNLQLNGQAGYLNTDDIGLGVEGTAFQGVDNGPSATQVNLGGGFPFVYAPAVVPVPGTAKVVHALSDLDTVKYAVFNDASPGSTTAVELNNVANWTSGLLLSAPEGDNDETHLSTGPSGVYLTYNWFVPNDNRISLRKFDASTNTFGAPTYIEGASAIDDNGADYPHHSQDASGRLHAVWRSLYDDGRLRYRRSDNGGASWTTTANLAVRETFIDPIVEAGTAGTGFAVWGGAAGGATPIRVVRIEPVFEANPAGPGGGGPDVSSPTVGGLGVGDSTLLPGQGTTFGFNTSEAGLAVLTIQKKVKGLKLKVKGKRRCLPQTKKRLRKLRKAAGSRRAFARLLRKRACKPWKRIGSIRKQVGAGRGTIVFNGRVAGRKLTPGLYRGVLKITDAAGNVSQTETIRFRVVKPKRRR